MGNFLLLAQVPAPDACGRWLDRFAAAFPAAGHVAIGFEGTDGAAADLGWFSEHGFTAEAQTVMMRADTLVMVADPDYRWRDVDFGGCSRPRTLRN